MEDPVDRRFVEEHEPLVRNLASRVRAQFELGIDLEELVAYGYQGLLEARSRFDASRGVQFSTFAHYRIRGAILDGVRAMAYLPRRIHAHRRAAEALDRAAENVALARATAPAADPAKSALESIDDILGRCCAAFVVSAVGQPSDGPPTPESELLSSEARSRVTEALELLPERERTLIDGYYYQGRTIEEIGAAMGLSRSWASRLHTRALGLLRDALDDLAADDAA